MIYKYTSCKRIVSKVLTDLDIQEGQKRIADIIEYIAEGLEKIGAFPQFVIKTTGRDGEPLLPITNYQARLPLGLHSVVQVIYSASASGPFQAMRYGTGTLDYNPAVTNYTPTTNNIVTETQAVTTVMSLYQSFYEQAIIDIPGFVTTYPTLYSYALHLYNTDASIRGQVEGLLTVNETSVPETQSGIVANSGYTYVIQGDYIKTSQPTGYLMVVYQSIPLDIDGLPLVPDDMSFIDALYWYVVTKLYYPEWAAGRIRDAVYYEAKRSWNFYRKQAYGNALMPNADQMESIKNTWLRIVPNLDAHSTFYSILTESENIYK